MSIFDDLQELVDETLEQASEFVRDVASSSARTASESVAAGQGVPSAFSLGAGSLLDVATDLAQDIAEDVLRSTGLDRPVADAVNFAANSVNDRVNRAIVAGEVPPSQLELMTGFAGDAVSRVSSAAGHVVGRAIGGAASGLGAVNVLLIVAGVGLLVWVVLKVT